MERCISEITKNGKSLIQFVKANDDFKMALLKSIQETM